MSSGLLSGQVTVIRYSALRSTFPIFFSGRISDNATKAIIAKPIRTLSKMSVNGTNVPSSLPPNRLNSLNIGTYCARHQRREYVDLGHLGDLAEEVTDCLVQKIIRQLQEQCGPNTRNGDVQRDCHAAGHAG